MPQWITGAGCIPGCLLRETIIAMNKELALFDFDGTITRKDTLIDFMVFALGRPAAFRILVRLLPASVAFARKKISNQEYKETFLTYAYRGRTVDELEKIAVRYASVRIPALVRPGAREELDRHKAGGHDIFLVSASASLWLKDWCRAEEIGLICSELEENDGRLTGRLAGKNCRGPEKVVRIRQRIDLECYGKIHAYGDSSGDTEMLAMAHEPHYRPFH